ncbi:unnamed protein product [Cercopithifilaria johnstoni]|uniref:Uncharacterized protein n=1 Tax=Cercopithifilaria johnstoni TaxID=2874296 RepID=A0A8J2Q5B9_9BILA|nr:unnamed protein product [Cercopithifilaria johnstoni]
MKDNSLNSPKPKMKLSPRKSEDQVENLKNISFESDHTKPPSSLSLSLGNGERKAAVKGWRDGLGLLYRIGNNKPTMTFRYRSESSIALDIVLFLPSAVSV